MSKPMYKIEFSITERGKYKAELSVKRGFLSYWNYVDCTFGVKGWSINPLLEIIKKKSAMGDIEIPQTKYFNADGNES